MTKIKTSDIQVKYSSAGFDHSHFKNFHPDLMNYLAISSTSIMQEK